MNSRDKRATNFPFNWKAGNAKIQAYSLESLQAFNKSAKTLLKDIYLRISPEDSNSIHESNNSLDFIVELPYQYAVEPLGGWEMAVVHISMTSDSGGSGGTLYVFCDQIEESVIYSRLKNVLWTINGDSDTMSVIFTPEYTRLKTSTLSQIRIYIRDQDFAIPTLSKGSVKITLHIRPVQNVNR